MHIEKTRLFATLSNAVRLRCLYLLASNGEVCVCEVVEALGITQPAASKALTGLKSAGLVRDRREANWIYYRLESELPDWIGTIVRATVAELNNCATCVADQQRFKRLVARPRALACP
ncbi:MAG: metalloregulator ArsR/SmtB family transcription factor [Gammaproteobacteria bacterium]|jgi:DNA-binding transcriptional ArsR family regulator|nr:metalloregulator ArsR/SmtB family transcription factor [Gammaproteobacteria bacterium]MBP6051354.1 metalloregulator ArsR/SmtB family transcription factor [Pseudomonadales bacterium]MBK6582873.1 metalloregulator ArsR/SmtB family transcription factor [Gammaproteobacteria bacterium]MBK7519002.1 metalloregulator ArsR/SmtB family transcription factor [Gammaproteobacteria bacterium]MBK7730257.1 metalloregulator ArsR/SmtB family transcription factor [Gammaproteobacteria bacterium]